MQTSKQLNLRPQLSTAALCTRLVGDLHCLIHTTLVGEDLTVMSDWTLLLVHIRLTASQQIQSRSHTKKLHGGCILSILLVIELSK